MPATLYVDCVIRLSVSVVPAVPATPNSSASPLAGGFGGFQLAPVAQKTDVLPTHASVPATARWTSPIDRPVTAAVSSAADGPRLRAEWGVPVPSCVARPDMQAS